MSLIPSRFLPIRTRISFLLAAALLVLPACMGAGQGEAQARRNDPQGESDTAARNAQARQDEAPAGIGPASEDEITFAQITDNRPLDLSRSGGAVGFVWGGWGAGFHGLGNGPEARARRAFEQTEDIVRGHASHGSFYYPMDRDVDKSHDMNWYRANRPDWAVYKCDRVSPAPIYTYYWGFNVPIDLTNPAVRDYILTQHIDPALSSGRKVIALDNVSLTNDSGRCGVYRDGQWHQLYSGEKQDRAYAAQVLDYVRWLSGEVHKRGGQLALNAKVIPAFPEENRELIALGDIWVMEAGFTRNCEARVSDQLWRIRFDLARWAASRMPWVDNDKTCAPPAEISDDEAQWVAGNFLLMRGSRSYLAPIHDGDGKGTISYPATLNPPVGRAQGDPFPVGEGWARRYSRGFVVVNPSSTSPLSAPLPEGSWVDIEGHDVSGTVTVQPASARILVSRETSPRR